MIVSRQNPKLKSIRRLRQCKDDRALLEGPHLVGEALRLGLVFESVLATPDFLETPAGHELAARLSPAPLAVEPALLRELSDVDSPQGIVGVVTLIRGDAQALPLPPDGLYVWAEGIQDPGNLGAVARSLEAAGGAGLAISGGCAHPNHPRALRASAGSLLRLPVARDSSPEGVRARLSGLGARWLALMPRDGASLYAADLSRPLVLAVGSEGDGLRSETVAACDLEITIPTQGGVESLNAAVAASVALFEIRRQSASQPALR